MNKGHKHHEKIHRLGKEETKGTLTCLVTVQEQVVGLTVIDVGNGEEF